jgi:hypothetical protein
MKNCIEYWRKLKIRQRGNKMKPEQIEKILVSLIWAGAYISALQSGNENPKKVAAQAAVNYGEFMENVFGGEENGY